MVSQALSVRFWGSVDKEGPVPPHCQELGQCWLWRGPTENGRGRLWVGPRATGGMRLANRVVWMLTHGDWPTLCVCHKCDNPLCVRPDHLFEGTIADNNRDRDVKGRQRAPRGSACGASRLTEEQTDSIREHYAGGRTSQRKLASRFGISQSQVGRIVRRENWSHM